MIDSEIEFSSDDVKIVKKQLYSLKNPKKLLNVERQESSIWLINKDFYFENSKRSTSLNSFNDVEISKNYFNVWIRSL